MHLRLNILDLCINKIFGHVNLINQNYICLVQIMWFYFLHVKIFFVLFPLVKSLT